MNENAELQQTDQSPTGSANNERKPSGLLGRLDSLSPWAFTGTLYLVRWVVIIPISILINLVVGREHVATISSIDIFFGVVFDPLLETLLECALPYWLMKKCSGILVGKRPWAFVHTSALMMVLLHFLSWPTSILPTMITGIFLGYTYAHFAAARTRSAILHTWAFHSGINLVGYLMLTL